MRAKNSVSTQIGSLEVLNGLPEYAKEPGKKILCRKLTLRATGDADVFLLIEMTFTILKLIGEIGEKIVEQVATSETIEFLYIPEVTGKTPSFILRVLDPLLLRHSFWHLQVSQSLENVDSSELLSNLLQKPKLNYTKVPGNHGNNDSFTFHLDMSPRTMLCPHIQIWCSDVAHSSNFLMLVLQRKEIQRIRLLIPNSTVERMKILGEDLKKGIPALTYTCGDNGSIYINRNGGWSIVDEQQSFIDCPSISIFVIVRRSTGGSLFQLEIFKLYIIVNRTMSDRDWISRNFRIVK